MPARLRSNVVQQTKNSAHYPNRNIPPHPVSAVVWGLVLFLLFCLEINVEVESLDSHHGTRHKKVKFQLANHVANQTGHVPRHH